MKKALLWILYVIVVTVVILPFEMVTYYGEIKFADWLKDALGI